MAHIVPDPVAQALQFHGLEVQFINLPKPFRSLSKRSLDPSGYQAAFTSLPADRSVRRLSSPVLDIEQVEFAFPSRFDSETMSLPMGDQTGSTQRAVGLQLRRLDQILLDSRKIDFPVAITRAGKSDPFPVG